VDIIRVGVYNKCERYHAAAREEVVMLKHSGSLSLILLLVISALFSGCGSGGGKSATLENPPFSRRTGQAAQSQDLVWALDNVDMPTNGEVLEYLNAPEDPETFLGALDVPSNIDGYYPLAPGIPSVRFQTGGQSPMMANNELIIAALARALTRKARGSDRDTTFIDFTGGNGIHWVGSSSYTTSGAVTVINLNVSGTRGMLATTVQIDSTSNLTLDANSSTSHSNFSYSFEVNGSIGSNSIELKATGSGTSNNFITFTPYVDSGNMYEECFYRTIIDDHFKYRSTTEMDLDYTSPEGADEDFTLDYSADVWLFAKDGYWVHAIAVLDSATGNSTYTLDALASDGFSLVFDGEVGYLFDDEDSILANLSFNPAEELAIKVDFTPTMQAQGTPDYAFIYLYMLD